MDPLAGTTRWGGRGGRRGRMRQRRGTDLERKRGRHPTPGEWSFGFTRGTADGGGPTSGMSLAHRIQSYEAEPQIGSPSSPHLPLGTGNGRNVGGNRTDAWRACRGRGPVVSSEGFGDSKALRRGKRENIHRAWVRTCSTGHRARVAPPPRLVLGRGWRWRPWPPRGCCLPAAPPPPLSSGGSGTASRAAALGGGTQWMAGFEPPFALLSRCAPLTLRQKDLTSLLFNCLQ